MLAVTYYGALSDPPITEYLPVLNAGYAGDKAMRLLAQLARNSGKSTDGELELTEIANVMNKGKPPSAIEYRRDGKFFRVLNRSWHETQRT
jgi:DNA repair protein RadD